MSAQPPVRYENYPPDQTDTPAGAFGASDPQTPVVRPYVPAQIPPPATGGGSSRRTVIGLLVGVPVVILGIGWANANRNDLPGWDSSGQASMPYEDTSGNTSDDSGDVEILVGDYSATVPSGWTSIDDGSGKTGELTNGANRLTAVGIETATSSVAVEEIAHLAKGHYQGFTGKIGDPVDRSSADVQHATMDGTGKHQGKVARLMVELWVDDNGSGLLVARVLTAKPKSTISVEAQGIVDELSRDF